MFLNNMNLFKNKDLSSLFSNYHEVKRKKLLKKISFWWIHKFSLIKLLNSGVHLGHYHSEWHSDISVFLLGRRNLISIFKLEFTLFLLRRALSFIKFSTKMGEQIFLISGGFLNYKLGFNKNFGFFNTIKLKQSFLKRFENKHPFLIVKPYGGCFTNLKNYKRTLHQLRIKETQSSFFFKLLNQLDLLLHSFVFAKNKNKRKLFWYLNILLKFYKSGLVFSKYSVSFIKQKKALKKSFNKFLIYKKRKINFFRFLYCINKLKVPGVVFVDSVLREKSIVLETLKLKIPIIGIIDSNVKYSGISYPIPGNDDSIASIKLYLSLIFLTILKSEFIFFREFSHYFYFTKYRFLIKRINFYKERLFHIKSIKKKFKYIKKFYRHLITFRSRKSYLFTRFLTSKLKILKLFNFRQKFLRVSMYNIFKFGYFSYFNLRNYFRFLNNYKSNLKIKRKITKL